MKLSRSVWRVGTLLAFIAFVSCLSVARPDILADNKFLDAFMGPDLVSVLVVALTITFASVANVHLSISRMVAAAPDPADAQQKAEPARRQLNSNAWSIFWALLVALGALFLHGATDDIMARSFATAICLTVVLLNGLVMHDIYGSIFILVASQIPKGPRNDGQDYSQDSPPTGEV